MPGCRLAREKCAECDGLAPPIQLDEIGLIRSHFLPTCRAVVPQQPASPTVPFRTTGYRPMIEVHLLFSEALPLGEKHGSPLKWKSCG